MRAIVIGLTAGLMLTGVASAQAVRVGSYLCSVEQLAGVGSVHLEGAGPPDAFTSVEVYRFRIVVTQQRDQFRIEEAPYDGPDRSMAQWEDDNSTLHGAYVGDGRAFKEVEGSGFLNFGRDRWGRDLQFYHAGFQYAGGEDESLAVRWGRCAPE